MAALAELCSTCAHQVEGGLSVHIAETIDVFLLAENRFLREALGKALARKNDVRVVGAAAFTPLVVKEIAETRPHVLLLDSTMFAGFGLQVVARVRADIPGVRVMMIGMEADKEAFLRCVRAGVAGYVLKDASALEIAAAVRAVAFEEAVCPPKLCLALFEYFANQSAHLPNAYGKLQLGLSRREQQLVQLVGANLTNKEIASRLNLSEQTVKNHVHRILRKLDVSDRMKAAEVCRHQGLFV